MSVTAKSLASDKRNPLAEHLKLSLNYDELTNCMRCGFCQPACPTFNETGLEAASPRGRIALMKAVADGLMDPDESFKAQLDLCLGCRACEPVCPSDVKYGQLLEQAREAIETHTERRLWVKLLRRLTFRHLFPHPKRMRLLGGLIALYQRTGLRSLVCMTGLLKWFPEHMRQMEAILPDASSKGVIKQLGASVYPAKGAKIARVGMFRGCIMDVLFTGTNVNTVKLLSESGFEVVIPDTQTCCGALHAHSGEMEQARALAKKNVRAFQDAQVDYIVSNAGGCGALLIEYDHLLHGDAEFAEAAAAFAAKVKDVSQLIVERGNMPDFSASRTTSGPLKITYQDSCHLRNVMKSGAAPRKLMSRVEGASFVELEQSDRCCGSAGIYNLVQPEMSTQILDHKMDHVKRTDCHVLVTSNPGCLLQMKLGIERHGLSRQMQAVHIVDLLCDTLKK